MEESTIFIYDVKEYHLMGMQFMVVCNRAFDFQSHMGVGQSLGKIWNEDRVVRRADDGTRWETKKVLPLINYTL